MGKWRVSQCSSLRTLRWQAMPCLIIILIVDCARDCFVLAMTGTWLVIASLPKLGKAIPCRIIILIIHELASFLAMTATGIVIARLA